MRLIIIESPYAAEGNIDRNVLYAREAVRHALRNGDSPIASHLLYTQRGILRDEVPQERKLGIDAGLAWLKVAEASVVYADLGISDGMRMGIEAAIEAGVPVEYRFIRVGDNRCVIPCDCGRPDAIWRTTRSLRREFSCAKCFAQNNPDEVDTCADSGNS